MAIRRDTGIVLLVFIILSLLSSPTLSWGQANERIGTVLAVDGTVEAQAANTTTWEPLQFRAAIFQNDTVRTGVESKVKVLLRDDSIMTLAERSEMQFTEFLLTPQQRRTVVSLTLGKLRVITTKIFGAGSVTEVRTANTVAGVRGTGFIVIFIPPDITQVLTLDGVVTVRNVNPAIPQIEPVPQNFRTQVRGDTAPTGATVLSPGERRAVEQDLRLTGQVPAEVKTSSERQAAAGPVRGEETTTAAVSPGVSAPAGAAIPAIPAAPLGTQPGQVAQVTSSLSAASLPSTAVTPASDTVLNTVQTLSKVTATAPPNTSPPVTPDSSPKASEVIQQRQPTNLRLTIRIPR